MTDMPPPYPGIYPENAGNGYTPSSNGKNQSNSENLFVCLKLN